MNAECRRIVHKIVRDDPKIELAIVHLADGSNEFFSHLPDADECERQRIVAVCRQIIDTIEAMPARKPRSDQGRPRTCSGFPEPSRGRGACPR